jgi:hypothetical protein
VLLFEIRPLFTISVLLPGYYLNPVTHCNFCVMPVYYLQFMCYYPANIWHMTTIYNFRARTWQIYERCHIFEEFRTCLCSSGLWRRVVSYADTNVSEKHTVSIPRPEDGGSSMFLRNFIYLRVHTGSESPEKQRRHLHRRENLKSHDSLPVFTHIATFKIRSAPQTNMYNIK